MARPRPVTATVFHEPDYPVFIVPRQQTTLSPGSSTGSLISILDHDSCESLPTSEDEEASRENTNINNNKLRKTEKNEGIKRPRKPSSSQVSSTPSSGKNGSSGNPVESISENTMTELTLSEKKESKLSAWEQWMVEKAKLLRQQQLAKIERRKKMMEEAELKQKSDELKAKEIDNRISEWQKQKLLEQKTRKKVADLQRKSQKEIEEAKKLAIKVKAEEKYKEWMEKKKKEEEDRKTKEMELKLKKAEEKEKKVKKNEEEFKKWLEKLKERPTTAPCSSDSRKNRGYYDIQTGYCNPIPWHPVQIPKEHSKSRNSAKRRQVKKSWTDPSKHR